MEAISWPLLLEPIHGLLGVTYALWASSQRGGQNLQGVFEEEQARLRAQVGHGGSSSHTCEGGHVPAAPAICAAPPMGMAGPAAAPAGAEEDAGAKGGDAPADPLAAARAEQSQDRERALSWVAGDPLGILFTLRMSLAPLATAMDNYLSVAGQRWERRQFAKEAQVILSGSGARRDYRVCLAAAGDMENAPLHEVRRLMADAATWEHVPFRHRSSFLRTQATLLLSKSGAGLYRLRRDHEKYPLKLFLILVDPAAAALVENEKECFFDAWTEGFVRHWTAKGGLQCPECIAELTGVAVLMELEMASVEALHASIRRLQHIRSVQTHSEHIADASAEFALRRFRALGATGPRPASDAEGNPDNPAPAPAKGRRARGKAGAWRAFIREETLGSEGKPDFGALADRYRALGEEQKAALHEIGRCALKRPKTMAASAAGSFGMTTRQQQRRNRKRALEAEADQRMEEDALGATGGDERVVRRKPRSLEMAPLGSVVGQSGYAMDVARSRRVDRRAERKAEELEKAIVARRNEVVGRPRLQRLGEDSRSLGNRTEEFEFAPDASLPTFTWLPQGVKERVRNALRVRARSSTGAVLYPLLESAWERLHTSTQSDPKLRKRMQALKPERTPCRDAGVCVCSESGKVLKKVAESLARHLASACPPHSRRREQIV